jgi:hypothetical protein
LADSNTPDSAAKWNYALDVETPALTIQRGRMPTRWDWPLDAPLKLEAKFVAFDWDCDPKAPRLPIQPVIRAKQPQTLTLVPYGCARFRVSMFPVAVGPAVKP